jgi:hypothetical protein
MAFPPVESAEWSLLRNGIVDQTVYLSPAHLAHVGKAITYPDWSFIQSVPSLQIRTG